LRAVQYESTYISEGCTASLFRPKEVRNQQEAGAYAFCLLLVSFLLGLIFSPEDAGSSSFQNIGELLLDYMALHPIIQYSSGSPL
jgi:hypothetical protein